MSMLLYSMLHEDPLFLFVREGRHHLQTAVSDLLFKFLLIEEILVPCIASKIQGSAAYALAFFLLSMLALLNECLYEECK